MCEKIEGIQKTRTENVSEDEGADLDKDEDEISESDSSTPSEHQSQASSAWKAPILAISEESQPVDLEALSLTPQVKEKEPAILPPTPEIKEQGLNCQKLGTSGCNKIRYKEVQKKLQAAPVFDALKTNGLLEGLLNKSFSQSLLEKVDEMAGSMTHGLLKQREKISDGVRMLAQKHPAAYNDIKDIFLGDSSIKEISDDLLHFTCAKRAEIIEMRRKAFKPREQHHARKLAEIPPSESHLFDEELLARFLNQQGGFCKVFQPSRKNFNKDVSTVKCKTARMHNGKTASQSFRPKPQIHSGMSSFRKPVSKEPRRDAKKNNSGRRDRGSQRF